MVGVVGVLWFDCGMWAILTQLPLPMLTIQLQHASEDKGEKEVNRGSPSTNLWRRVDNKTSTHLIFYLCLLYGFYLIV